MTFINNCINYVKANPLHGIIAAALALFILILLIIIITLCAKRSKAKKRLKENEAKTATAQASQTEIANTVTEMVTPTEAENAPIEQTPQEKAIAAREAARARQEAAWKEVEAKLEAQRLAAEQEEAEQAAKAKAAENAAERVENAQEKSTAKKTTKTVKTEKNVKTPKAAPAKAKTTEAPAKEPVKEAKEVNVTETADENASKYTGKWVIYRVLTEGEDADEMYFFELRASNGEKLLSSEEYTSYNGALKGIETHKTNIEKGNFRITLSKKGHYIFKILSGKNTLLCTGENYSSRVRCESAIESTKRFAKTAFLDETVQEQLVKIPVEEDTEIVALPENSNGKWIIAAKKDADGEDLFYFELFANNGEKLLTSEDYTTYIGAVNGITTHKTNIEKGNFRISLTKRGDYIYKLLNGNGQLLSLGEHYKTKRLCQSAVESVKRFAKNSPVLTDPNLTK